MKTDFAICFVDYILDAMMKCKLIRMLWILGAYYMIGSVFFFFCDFIRLI